MTSYFHSWSYWWGGDYIVTLYFHSWQYLVRGWIYPDIFSLLTIFSEGVNISWHYIFTPDNIWWGGWLYRDIIFSPLTVFGQGVIISWHYIFTPGNIWWGGDYIVTYFHSWQYLVRGWIYPDIIFSLLTIFGEGGDYILTLYFHPWQYLVRGWLYRDIIFSLLAIFGEGVIISWHYIFTPGNIWWGGDYILTYFHSWQYLVRGVNILWHYIFTPDNIWWGGWLYRDIIFSPLTVFGQGVIISWHYIFTPDNIGEGGDYIMTSYFHSWQYLVRGVIISWRYIFTPDNIWSGGGGGGDYIVTQYSHPWQYLVRGWLYRDIIFSLQTIFGKGGDYIVILYFHPWQYLVRGVNILWHYIFTPDNIWWGGGDYIVTLYFHPWQYLVRGWLYRDIIFSLLIILVRGVIISWHYIFTPGNIWWGGDYIVTLYFHSWQYLVGGGGGGGLYRDTIFSPLTIFGQGVMISWHHIFTPGNISWGSD